MLVYLSAAVSVVAALVAYGQLTLMKRLSRAETSSDMLHDLFSAEARVRRGSVWDLKRKPLADWSKAEFEQADLVATQMSLVGMMIKHGYADGKAFYAFYHGPCVELFRLLLPYVERMRVDYEDPEQWIYFEWLARRASLWGKRRTHWSLSPRWVFLKSRTRDMPSSHA